MRKNGLRNLPTMEQPYEKCLENGPESLSDAELLAVILRCGARGKTSLELAREILSLPGKEEGLLGLYHCTRQELLQIRGVGEVKAIQLQCIGELSKRMAAAGARKGLCFHDPASIADYYMERLRHEDQEVLLCMMLDTKNSFSEKRKLTRGTDQCDDDFAAGAFSCWHCSSVRFIFCWFTTIQAEFRNQAVTTLP